MYILCMICMCMWSVVGGVLGVHSLKLSFFCLFLHVCFSVAHCTFLLLAHVVRSFVVFRYALTPWELCNFCVYTVAGFWDDTDSVTRYFCLCVSSWDSLDMTGCCVLKKFRPLLCFWRFLCSLLDRWTVRPSVCRRESRKCDGNTRLRCHYPCRTSYDVNKIVGKRTLRGQSVRATRAFSVTG